MGSGPSCVGDRCRYNSPRPSQDLIALRIDWQPSLEFPGGSKTNYLYLAGLAVGAIKFTDTLVSTVFTSLGGFGAEFLSYSNIRKRSWASSSPFFDPSAVSDEEYTYVYDDTNVTFAAVAYSLDAIDRRKHEPIGVEVHQTSRSWSDGTARRFIIFDLWIRNISGITLKQACVGINIWPNSGNYDADPYMVSPSGINCGYMRQAPTFVDGRDVIADSIQVAWYANSSGIPTRGSRRTARPPRSESGCCARPGRGASIGGESMQYAQDGDPTDAKTSWTMRREMRGPMATRVSINS